MFVFDTSSHSLIVVMGQIFEFPYGIATIWPAFDRSVFEWGIRICNPSLANVKSSYLIAINSLTRKFPKYRIYNKALFLRFCNEFDFLSDL